MKSPRNAGPMLLFATAISLAIVAVSKASSPLAHASMSAPEVGEGDGIRQTVAGKICRFGQRYSTYYRRCVVWTPFDFR